LIRGDLFIRSRGTTPFCSLGNNVFGSGLREPAQRHFAGPGMELDLAAQIASQTGCDDLESLRLQYFNRRFAVQFADSPSLRPPQIPKLRRRQTPSPVLLRAKLELVKLPGELANREIHVPSSRDQALFGRQILGAIWQHRVAERAEPQLRAPERDADEGSPKGYFRQTWLKSARHSVPN
jgi:hypothetical protein